MRDYSFQINKKQFDYLLPIYGYEGTNQLFQKIDKFYFIGTHEEFLQLLNRCKYL